MQLQFKERQLKLGNVTRFVFTPVEPLSWKPGQYIHYTLPHKNSDDRGDERWFTISSAPYEKQVWITTRINKAKSSTFKQTLLNLQPDDVIETNEPEGNFIVEDLGKEYVFVAGGIGITPFRSILSQLHHDGQDIRLELLYANRDENNIPFRDELESISQVHDGINITYFNGDNKIDEAALRDAGSKLNNPIYYVSGPEPMVETFKEILVSMGIDEEHSKFDYFPGYEAE